MTTYEDTAMTKIFHPLLALIASATDKELAKYVEYLKHENKILRARLPRQVHTRHEERQKLLKYGKAIGRAIEELISIVSPATFYNWVRNEKNGKPKPKNPKGGQRKPKELRELVLTIAKETGFGLTRIVGELRKLGINKISRQTVRNILKEWTSYAVSRCVEKSLHFAAGRIHVSLSSRVLTRRRCGQSSAV